MAFVVNASMGLTVRPCFMTPHTGQDCDHLDYSDTLDGATCNTAG